MHTRSITRIISRAHGNSVAYSIPMAKTLCHAILWPPFSLSLFPAPWDDKTKPVIGFRRIEFIYERCYACCWTCMFGKCTEKWLFPSPLSIILSNQRIKLYPLSKRFEICERNFRISEWRKFNRDTHRLDFVLIGRIWGKRRSRIHYFHKLDSWSLNRPIRTIGAWVEVKSANRLGRKE